MLSTIQQLLEKQDTQTLTAALLHSSRWLLGERLHYGPIQQRGLMANWLDITTHFETVELCAKVQSGDVEAGVFCLSSASTTTYFIAQCEHRNGAIKQLLQWVDSASLAAHYNTKEAPGYDNSMSLPFWPEPDPLQLSEFDPQLHLKETRPRDDSLCRWTRSLGSAPERTFRCRVRGLGYARDRRLRALSPDQAS